MELAAAQIDLALPLDGAAKTCIVEQALDTFLFTLQQLPATIAQLRKWKQELEVAEAKYVEQTGRLAPRSLTRRRALTFLAQYEALLASLRLLMCGPQAQAEGGEAATVGATVLPVGWYIHSVLLILGPNLHNPKQVFHVTYSHNQADDTLSLQHALPFKFPAPRLLPPPEGRQAADAGTPAVEYDEDEDRQGLGEDDMEVDNDGEERDLGARHVDASNPCSAGAADLDASLPLLIPATPYPCPLLPPATANALARKVARTLITESVKLCGLRGLGPQKLIVMVQASPLQGEGGLILPEGWVHRPNFTLKPPVKLVKAGSRNAPAAAVGPGPGAGLGPLLGPLGSLPASASASAASGGGAPPRGAAAAAGRVPVPVPQGWVPLNNAEQYKLSVIRVSGPQPSTAAGSGSSATSMAVVEGAGTGTGVGAALSWYQAAHTPQGFRDRLPAHSKPKVSSKRKADEVEDAAQVPSASEPPGQA